MNGQFINSTYSTTANSFVNSSNFCVGLMPPAAYYVAECVTAAGMLAELAPIAFAANRSGCGSAENDIGVYVHLCGNDAKKW